MARRSAVMEGLFASVLSLCTPCLPAQVEARFVAATDLRVSAAADFPVQQMVPAGTALADPWDIQAVAPCAFFNGAASARMSLSSTMTATGFLVRFRGSAGSATSVPGFGCGSASVGPHAVVVTMSAPTPRAGRIRITAEASAHDPQCQLFCPRPSFGVDVQNDGTEELSFEAANPQGAFPFTVEIPVVLDGQGVELGLRHHLTDGSLQIDLEFLPDPLSLQTLGSPCGPTLRGVILARGDGSTSLELVASGSIATPHAFFVFGTQDLFLPLPQLGCPRLTDLLIALRVPVNPMGRATLSVPIPVPVPLVDLRAQYMAGIATRTGPAWVTSNGIRIVLP